jgi:C-terminal processing protease CtpA/Prc
VLVSEVEKDTPAEKAGVKAGDVITKIDGEIVESPSDLREIIRDHDKGDKVAVDLIRKGQPMTLTAELDETSGGSSYGNAIQQYLGQSKRAPGADRLRMFYSDEDEKALQEEMEQLKEELKSLKDELGEIRERMK